MHTNTFEIRKNPSQYGKTKVLIYTEVDTIAYGFIITYKKIWHMVLFSKRASQMFTDLHALRTMDSATSLTL